MQLAVIDLDHVDRANLFSVFVESINQFRRGDFVRQREIETNELQIAHTIEPIAQLVGQNVKPRVLHLDAVMLERSVLHLRRERMFHRIAKNAEANRRIDIAASSASPPECKPPSRSRASSSFRSELASNCAVETLQHPLFSHDFQHVIQTRPDTAAADRDSRRMNEVAGFATKFLGERLQGGFKRLRIPFLDLPELIP